MKNFFKDKLISSYANIMEQKTSEIVSKVAEERDNLKLKLDDLFSLEPDKVLNEINNKINNTIYSVDLFNSHFNTFQISKDLEDFLYNFGTMNIQPKFDGIIEVLNNEAKYLIVNKIDKNSLEYTNYYDNKEFIEKADLAKEEINKIYINNINKAVDNYGKEEYPNNLEKEIVRQYQIIYRRLNQPLSENEIENNYKKNIADKTLDDTLSKILISSNNAKRFIDNYENFDIFDKMVNENINKLNIAYKKSLKIINDNDFTEEVNNELILKLKTLTAFSLHYFDSINKKFYDLKTYLKSSINDIKNNINKCANLTYITFSEKYEELSKIKETNSVTITYLDEISDSIIIENQNKIIEVNYTILQISKKAQFKSKIDFEEEGGIKKPKIYVSIINEIRPKQIKFKFINGDIIERINIEPNNINFTMTVYFSTKSKDLYVTTFTDFESYKYSTEIIQMQENFIEKCLDIQGISFCYSGYEYFEDNPKILSAKRDKIIPKKTIIEEFIIHESNIFKEYLI